MYFQRFVRAHTSTTHTTVRLPWMLFAVSIFDRHHLPLLFFCRWWLARRLFWSQKKSASTTLIKNAAKRLRTCFFARQIQLLLFCLICWYFSLFVWVCIMQFNKRIVPPPPWHRPLISFFLCSVHWTFFFFDQKSFDGFTRERKLYRILFSRAISRQSGRYLYTHKTYGCVRAPQANWDSRLPSIFANQLLYVYRVVWVRTGIEAGTVCEANRWPIKFPSPPRHLNMSSVRAF